MTPITNITSEFTPRVDENGNPVAKLERRPKRKVAGMIGYCGTGYNGMQIQNDPNVKTIEGELFNAFVEAGAVSKDNADDIKKNAFMRAARTDKGVHAAGNVILAKLIVEDEDIIEKINQALPDQIRIWGIQRVTKLFDCRKMCSLRIYEYLLPTYSLLPPKPHSALADLIEEKQTEHPGTLLVDEEGSKWWDETRQEVLATGVTEQQLEELLAKQKAGESIKTYDSEGQITEEGQFIRLIKNVENARRRAYRILKERLQRFREAMEQYVGSNNFHNFTVGKSFKDPALRRYIMETLVLEPFVIEGTEWVLVKLHGQLFMLHQIRKMIAMACLVVRTGCPVERIKQFYGPNKINIPKAPALGLLLENPVYTTYNKMLEKNNHKAIDFTEFSEKMDAFKMKYIYDKIYAEEARDNVFYGFFGFIDSFKAHATEGVPSNLRELGEGEIGHVFEFLGKMFDEPIQEEQSKKETDSKEEQPKKETDSKEEQPKKETASEEEQPQE